MPEWNIEEFDNYENQYFSSTTFLHLFVNQFVELQIRKNSTIDESSQFTAIEIATFELQLLELIDYAIKIGVDINAKDMIGKTVLETALLHNAHNLTILLIQSGADVNHKNTYGLTPLFQVIQNSVLQYIDNHEFILSQPTPCPSNIEIIQALLAAGADTSVTFHDENANQSLTIINYIDSFIHIVNSEMNSWNVDINRLVILKNELVTIKAILQS